jgi:hypothetical protein
MGISEALAKPADPEPIAPVVTTAPANIIVTPALPTKTPTYTPTQTAPKAPSSTATPTLTPTATPLSLPDDVFQPRGPHCCSIMYNGSPVCTFYTALNVAGFQSRVCGALTAAGSVTENPDCVYRPPDASNSEGQCLNRWLLNAQTFKFPKECDTTFRFDSSRGDGEYESVLRTNKCDDVTTYYYQHGNPQMCELFFKRASYCLSLKRGSNIDIQILACSVFQDLYAVKKEVDAVAQKMQNDDFTGVLKICGAPHDQAINIGGEELCPNNPDGARPVLNARYCVTITSSKATTNFPLCKDLNDCASFQLNQFAYCNDGKDTKGKTIISKLQCLPASPGNPNVFGYLWTYVERPAAHQPLPTSQNASPPYRRGLFRQATDFDRDGVAEIAMVNTRTGTIRALSPRTRFVDTFSQGGFAPSKWGLAGDFNADGFSDVTSFDSAARRATSSLRRVDEKRDLVFSEGIPVSGDFDGDGQTDLATFVVSKAEWRISSSRDHSMKKVSFGLPGLKDFPVPADFDGDGTTDLAVWRSGNGTVNVLFSKGGNSSFSTTVSGSGVLPAFADYDGDGRADPIMFVKKTKRWTGMLSGGGWMNQTFGEDAEVPLLGAPVFGAMQRVAK